MWKEERDLYVKAAIHSDHILEPCLATKGFDSLQDNTGLIQHLLGATPVVEAVELVTKTVEEIQID